ncbi:hypothetical protein PRIPAC_76804, partial [Pristionchus pacificus]
AAPPTAPSSLPCSPCSTCSMLFTSGIRKAVDAYNPSAAAILTTAEETAKLLEERRKKQMLRRHTCSTLRPEPRVSLQSLQSDVNVISEHSEWDM